MVDEQQEQPFAGSPGGDAWRDFDAKDATAYAGGRGDSVRAKFEDAHLRYVRAMQEAWYPEETRRRAEASARGAAREARATYDPEEVQGRLNEGTAEYVRAVQEAVADLDPGSVDMATIGAIGQSLAAASWAAACSGAAVRSPYAYAAPQWGWGWGVRAW